MEHDLKIIFHDEVQLLGWGETRDGGPWIKLRLSEPELLDVFRGMDTPTLKKTGHVMNMTLSMGDIIAAAPKPEKGPHGKEASKLHQSGFFRTPAIWKALGTDEKYREWIQTQNCMCCGNQDWVEEIGEGRCEAAHVLRADTPPSMEGAHPGKPNYSCVPLCNKHHALQHKKGESMVYAASRSYTQEEEMAKIEETAKEWFDVGKIHYLELWAHEQLCNVFSIPSLTFLEPDALIAWAVEAEVDNYLPRNYGGPA